MDTCVGLRLTHDFKNAVDELLPLEIAKLTQHHAAAKVILTIGVTAWTPQRTLTRDFQR
jgi:hypothetical protein